MFLKTRVITNDIDNIKIFKTQFKVEQRSFEIFQLKKKTIKI